MSFSKKSYHVPSFPLPEGVESENELLDEARAGDERNDVSRRFRGLRRGAGQLLQGKSAHPERLQTGLRYA